MWAEILTIHKTYTKNKLGRADNSSEKMLEIKDDLNSPGLCWSKRCLKQEVIVIKVNRDVADLQAVQRSAWTQQLLPPILLS